MNWKIVLALLVSFALLMSSSYTMLIPFLPIYLDKELGASRESLSMWSGLVFAISFAISAFAAPLWGKLSDKMGKKPMIIRSSVLIAITYFLAGIVTTPFELFLVRAFQGVAAGLWPACLVMLSAYAPKKKLGFAMGLMQSANITGSILGPLLGGILATSFGMRNSFFIGAAFGCLFGNIFGFYPTLCTAIGMTSVFCGVTNCPITSLLISFELFGYDGMPFFLLAIAFSYVLSGYYGLYKAQKIMYSKYRTNYINKTTE